MRWSRNPRRTLLPGTRAGSNPSFFTLFFVRGLVRPLELVYFFDAFGALIKYHFLLYFFHCLYVSYSNAIGVLINLRLLKLLRAPFQEV